MAQVYRCQFATFHEQASNFDYRRVRLRQCLLRCVLNVLVVFHSTRNHLMFKKKINQSDGKIKSTIMVILQSDLGYLHNFTQLKQY